MSLISRGTVSWGWGTFGNCLEVTEEVEGILGKRRFLLVSPTHGATTRRRFHSGALPHLLLEKLLLPRDVSSVALGQHVLSDG